MNESWILFQWDNDLKFIKNWAIMNKDTDFANCVFTVVYDPKKLQEAILVEYYLVGQIVPHKKIYSDDKGLLSAFKRFVDSPPVNFERRIYEKKLATGLECAQTLISIRPTGPTHKRFTNRVWFRHTGTKAEHLL